MYGTYSFLHLGEEIDEEKFVIVEFYVEADVDILTAAEALAAESSVGTWTGISTMHPEILNKLGARVFVVDDDSNIVKIAYPLDLFEPGNMPQVLSDVAGNVFGMKEIENLRVKNITYPERYVESFMGPAFGISGIRQFFDEPQRPLLGTIIKPKVGLSSDEHAKVAFEAWVGGVEVVKDDENLTDQAFNPFEERVVKTIMMKSKAEDLTGKKKMYVPNITAPSSDMERRAEFVKVQGGECIMMDVITVGFGGVQHIRNQNFGLILHGHRAMHGAFTHNTKHGIAMLPIATASRLCGIDQLHTGTIIGKMEGGKEDVKEINKAMRKDWFGIKPTMPIASGGVHPGLIPKMIELIGSDVIINLGGGIHGHPDGTRKGAMAARQAVDASLSGVSLEEYAKDHEELAKAIDKWGTYGNSKLPKSLVTYQYNLSSRK
ncbi:MAG: type III ribulose-bisphosphate carboxylase [bacterium]